MATTQGKKKTRVVEIPHTAGIFTYIAPIDMGGGILDLPAADISFYDGNDTSYRGALRTVTMPTGVTGSGGVPSIPSGYSILVAEWNAGVPRWNIVTDTSTIGPRVIRYLDIFRLGTELHVMGWGEDGRGLAETLCKKDILLHKIDYETGCMIGETTGNRITLTSGFTWHGAARQSHQSCDSGGGGSNETQFWYHAAGVWTYSLVTTYNNTQYDNGTNLVTATASKYLIVWVYRGEEDAPHLYYVLGNAEYPTATEAEAASVPTASLLPPIINNHTFFAGRIVVQKSAASATSITSAFTKTLGGTGGGSSDHETLSNLLGGLTLNHHHIANFASVALAEAATGGASGIKCWVEATKTLYEYDSASGLTRDGLSILNTGAGGSSRWVAHAGRYAGRWEYPTNGVTASRTLTLADAFVICTNTSNITITLPTAVGIAGKVFQIKRNGTGKITVSTTSSQTIDGDSAYTINSNYSCVTVVSDGSNWLLI